MEEIFITSEKTAISKDILNKLTFTRLTNNPIRMEIKNKQYKNQSSPSGLTPIKIFHISCAFIC